MRKPVRSSGQQGARTGPQVDPTARTRSRSPIKVSDPDKGRLGFKTKLSRKTIDKWAKGIEVKRGSFELLEAAMDEFGIERVPAPEDEPKSRPRARLEEPAPPPSA